MRTIPLEHPHGPCQRHKRRPRAFNAFQDDLQTKVYQAHRLLTEADELINAETIRNKLLGKTEKPRSLIAICKDHNKKVEALIGKEYAKGTLCRYQTSLKHTIDFLKWKYNLTDIDKQGNTIGRLLEKLHEILT